MCCIVHESRVYLVYVRLFRFILKYLLDYVIFLRWFLNIRWGICYNIIFMNDNNALGERRGCWGRVQL